MKQSKLDSFKLKNGTALSTADMRQISGGEPVTLGTAGVVLGTGAAVVGAFTVGFVIGYSVSSYVISKL
jgi:hypothetical protein